MELALALYLAFALTTSTFYLITTGIYVIYYAKSLKMEEFDKKSGRLVVSFIVGVTVLTLSDSIGNGLKLVGATDPGCFQQLFWNNIGYNLAISSLGARAVRLLVQYRLSLMRAAKVETSDNASDLQQVNDTEGSSGAKHAISWRQAMRYFFISTAQIGKLGTKDSAQAIALYSRYLNEWIYVRFIFVYVCLLTVIFLILYFVKAGNPLFDACRFSDAAIVQLPLYMMLALFLFVISPILVILLRGVQDIYGIRKSLSLQAIVGGSTFLLYFILTASPLSLIPVFVYFKPVMFALIGVFIMHVELIVVPLVRIAYGRKFYSDNVKVQKDFSQCLSDPKMYEQLKQLSIEAFASENVKFWEDYLSLMQMCYYKMLDEVINSLSSDQLAPNTLTRRTSTIGSKLAQAFSRLTDKSNNSAGSDAQFLERLKKLRFELSVVFNPVLIRHLSKRESQRTAVLASNGSPSVKDVNVSADQASVISGSSSLQSKSSDPISILAELDCNVEIDAVIRRKLIQLYEKYMDRDASYQINVAQSTVQNVAQVVKKIKAGDYTSIDLKPSVNRASNDEDATVLNIAPFDKVKEDVLEMIRTNIYSKMLISKSGNKLQEVA
ncbi:hypothetical protein MP228_003544 [Amoeboaphelidium protococcarum]|nr:hypothetical protein MP228_003544 [Amoeboaphelidium protococcarum]